MPQTTYNHFQVVSIILTIILAIFKPTLSSEIITPQILLRMRQTLRNCRMNMDCPENAYCWDDGTCLCRDGFLVGSNRTKLQCLRVATNLRDSCREDDQCRVTFTVQAECRDNVCVCSEGSHYDVEQKRCYASAGIGQMCHTNYNCHVEGSPSYCVDGYCSCPLLHHVTADKKSCLRSLHLGDNCTIHDECFTPNSRCYRTCDCAPGHVLSEDKKQCLKAANSIGDDCEEDSQCRAFSEKARCGEEKTCTCALDFKKRGPVCLRKIDPDMMGKSCSSRSQCVKPMPETDLAEEEVVNVDCLNGECSCARDYILTEDKTDCIRFSENDAGKTMANWLLILVIVSRLISIV